MIFADNESGKIRSVGMSKSGNYDYNYMEYGGDFYLRTHYESWPEQAPQCSGVNP